MPSASIFLAGFALFVIGLLLAASQLFGHGGWAKSAQFRVMGELLRGAHGRRARRVFALGLTVAPIGICVIFAGVAAMDGERATRCAAECASSGHASSRIGPNTDRDPNDRRTWFVACICEGAGQPPREFRAER